MTTKKDKDSGLGDVIKKVVSIGVGAAFMTEDTVKNLLGDLPLPKDIVNGLVTNAKSAKEDFANSVREEIGQHLSKVDPKRLMEDIIQDYDIEVNAKFSFKKKENSKDNE
jgi:polyhydroxyalkanoate synthesis regulator phasin